MRTAGASFRAKDGEGGGALLAVAIMAPARCPVGEDEMTSKASSTTCADSEGPFTVYHCWKILRGEPKWYAVLEEHENSKKRGLDGGSDFDSNNVMQDDIGEKERPMGRNEAKKQRNGKGKGKANDDDDSLHEDMKKYMDIQAAASKRHEEFLETQHRISDAKVVAARLRREAVLTESYQKLMSMDTSQMTDEMKAEHMMGLKMLRDKLLGNTT